MEEKDEVMKREKGQEKVLPIAGDTYKNNWLKEGRRKCALPLPIRNSRRRLVLCSPRIGGNSQHFIYSIEEED